MKRILSTLGITLLAIATMAQVPNYVPTNGLVGYWPFNGNANDESGNGNNGTVNGATLTTDRFGTANAAYYFSSSGCGTRIDFDVPDMSSIQGFTISFWASRNGNGCINPRLWEFWGGSITQQCAWVNADNFIGSGGLNTQGIALGNNTWYHFVFTSDGQTQKVFVNGAFNNDQIVIPGGTGEVPNSTDFAIGRMNHPAYDAFNGKIDDIGIWNRALTEQEITDLYNAELTTPCEASVDLGPDTLGLCGGDSLLLDAGAGYNYYDWSTGDNTQSIYASTTGNYSVTVGDSVGVDNDYSMSFDGVDDYVEIPSLTLGSEFTIMFSAKNSDSIDFGELVSIGGNLTIVFDNDTTLVFNIGNSGNYSSWHFSQNPEFHYSNNFNSWNHYTLQYQSDTVSVFFNGLNVYNGYAPGYSISGITWLGDRNFNSSWSYNLGGNLDNVQMWDIALSQSEIQQYMSCPPTGNETGLVGYWNFEEGSGTTVFDQTSNGNDGTINGATYSTDVPEQICISCTATDSVYLDVLNAQIAQNDTTICFGDSVELGAVTSQQESTVLSECNLTGDLSLGLSGAWPFCGNASDETGSGNNGTVNGPTLTSDRFGNPDKAYYFDGNDDYISLAEPFFQGSTSVSSFTYASTFKVDELPASGSGYSISRKEGYWRSLGLSLGSGGNISFGGSQPSPQSYISVGSSDNVIVPNTWHVAVVKYENSILELYLDGSLVGTTTIIYSALDFSWVVQGNSTATNHIGAAESVSLGVTQHFKGIIDDLRTWDRALSESEIQQLYSGDNSTYAWSTGATEADITVTPTATTTYTVTVDNGITTCTDSVTVTVSNPTVDLGADTLGLCAGDSILLDAGAGYNYYDWSTGDNTQSIYASTTGNYSVTVGGYGNVCLCCACGPSVSGVIA